MNPSNPPEQQPISDDVWMELAAAHTPGDSKPRPGANRLAPGVVVAAVGSCGLLTLLAVWLATGGRSLFFLGFAALAVLLGLALAFWRTGPRRLPPPAPILKDVPLCIIYDPP